MKKHFLSAFLVLSIGSSLSACGTLPSGWRSGFIMSDDGFKPEDVTEEIRRRLGQDEVGPHAPFSMGVEDPTNPDYQTKRDNIQAYLKTVSDRNCLIFMTHSLSTQTRVNFGLKSTALILSGVGGLRGPESTSQALAGASAMTTGVAQQVNSDFYREKTVEILTKAIRTKREGLWADIKARQLSGRTDKDRPYLINEAIRRCPQKIDCLNHLG